MTDYEKLKKLINDTDKLIKKGIQKSDMEFTAWDMDLRLFIGRVYGTDSIVMRQLLDVPFEPSFTRSDIPDRIRDKYKLEACQKGLETSKLLLEKLLDDLDDEAPTETHIDNLKQADLSKIFIVHGHDGELKLSVKSIIEKQDIIPIILSEQANKGRTIIEKFEENSDVGCAICLFTADDIGKAKDSNDDKFRARQNVVFEAGYFMGKLGRDHIVILSYSDVEIPSDLAGVVYTNTRNWEVDLLKELRAMGYQIDLNKL